jgi:hypothetical protein
MTTASSKPKATRKATTAPAPTSVDKSRSVEVFVKPGETQDRAVAGMVARGLVTNASTVIRFSEPEHNGLSLMDMARELRDQGEAVNRGDLSALERMLTAQALSLNAIFGELARVAKCNLFKVPDVADRYLRLALRAQSQSRATVETLAAVKNPPVVFARQANIAHGPQQVNNGGAAPTNTRTGAHAGQTPSAPNELSRGSNELLPDTAASQATSGAHLQLEAVGAINRAAQP